MREPFPSEEDITIVDNKGRERVQRVEYVVLDVRGEKVYVTADGLAYTEDSLGRIKGYRERVPPQVWYIAPGKRRRDFGLRQK